MLLCPATPGAPAASIKMPLSVSMRYLKLPPSPCSRSSRRTWTMGGRSSGFGAARATTARHARMTWAEWNDRIYQRVTIKCIYGFTNFVDITQVCLEHDWNLKNLISLWHYNTHTKKRRKKTILFEWDVTLVERHVRGVLDVFIKSRIIFLSQCFSFNFNSSLSVSYIILSYGQLYLIVVRMVDNVRKSYNWNTFTKYEKLKMRKEK